MKLGIAESIEAQSKIGVVILAAGVSARMGKPKQLLLYRGQTIIRRAVETALGSVCRPIVVVVGAQAEVVKRHDSAVGLAARVRDRRSLSLLLREGLLVSINPASVTPGPREVHVHITYYWIV